MSREHVETLIAAAVPMSDAGVDRVRAEINLEQHESYESSCYLPKTDWYSLMARLDQDAERIAALTAERDAAVARAMPEPRFMATVEEVEALPAGAYLICSRLNRTRAFCAALAPCAERWEVGGRLWPDRTMVGCILSGPLPDLPTPTAAQEG
jgi:hypothetical protein